MVGQPEALARALGEVTRLVRANPPKEKPGGPPPSLAAITGVDPTDQLQWGGVWIEGIQTAASLSFQELSPCSTFAVVMLKMHYVDIH